MRVFIVIAALLALYSYSPKINYSIEIYLPDTSNVNSGGIAPTEFIILKEHLPEMPFINDEGIEQFDTANFKITFSKEAAAKIKTLKPGLAKGIPFVLAVDREPVLSGYFINTFSSVGCRAYVLNTRDRVQRLTKGLPEHYYEGLIAERRNSSIFIQALERTGRLK